MSQIDTTPFLINDASKAQWLVQELSDASGKKPWVVMSTASGEKKPRFDLDAIQAELAGIAKLAIVVDGEAPWTLSSLLVDYEDVYGGAARVYPAGYTPGSDLKPGPVRTLQRGQPSAKQTERLVSDALGLAYQAGVFDTKGERSRVVEGCIRGFVGDHRALVDVDGGFASLAEETTYPGVPLSWLYKVGQTITGRYTPRDGRFLADTHKPTAEELTEHFPYGSVTWALVLETDRQKSALSIHPGHRFTVSKPEVCSNPLDRVDLLLNPGEVVPARLYRDQQGRTRLRLDDIDDEETILEALNFGAGPWLVDGRDLVDEDESEDITYDTDRIDIPSPSVQQSASPNGSESTSQAPPKPGPGSVRVRAGSFAPAGDAEPTVDAGSGKNALESMKNQLHSTQGQLKVAQARLQRLGGDKAEVLYNQVREERNQAITELNRVREQQRELRADLQELRKKLRLERGSGHTSNALSRQSRFAHPDHWFHEEVRRTWISLYTPQERQRWALDATAWTIGERFTDSVGELRDSQIRRLTKLVVHLVTGRNGEENLIESHPLRTADEVSSPPVTGADGAVCLRAYVEERVSQSRRLHYWKLPDGSLELSRVVQHDDMQP